VAVAYSAIPKFVKFKVRSLIWSPTIVIFVPHLLMMWGSSSISGRGGTQRQDGNLKPIEKFSVHLHGVKVRRGAGLVGHKQGCG